MMAKMSRHALRFEKVGLNDWIAWVRRGAYLLQNPAPDTWCVSFMPQLSAKNPKPVWSRIELALATQHAALMAAQAHEDLQRTARKGKA